jgi:hypothetical protein
MDVDPGELGEVEGQFETADEVEVSSEPAPAPEKQYVEVDDPDNRYVRVKINGEDVEVPYSEALGGYSRTADYTRKTQELAQEREQAQYGLAIQQALETDPEAALAFLAQRYKANLGGQQQPLPEPEPDYADPLERAIAEERQARLALQERIEAREADELLERTVNGIRRQYGAQDEDLLQAARVAQKQNLPIEALPMVYKQIMFDKIAAHAQAQRMTREQSEAETQRRQAAAANASSVSAGGTRSAGGLTSQREVDDGRMSLREAFEAAYAQHSDG